MSEMGLRLKSEGWQAVVFVKVLRENLVFVVCFLLYLASRKASFHLWS